MDGWIDNGWTINGWIGYGRTLDVWIDYDSEWMDRLWKKLWMVGEYMD